jgi:competence protein ComGC
MLDTELAEFPEFEHALVQDLHEMIGKFRFD